MENTENKQEMQHSKHAMYGRFAVMAVVMFIAMYLIMFAMIDRLQNLIPNINNLYMTLLMVSVMILIELWMMKKMYTDSKLNLIIVVIAIVAGVFSWSGIREQIYVGDKEFVKGMIPHHVAAVLMSEKTKLTDPELIELQKSILESQSKEIELMRRKLSEFEKAGK
ncbi:DUF305 domain-containing protein [Chryseobacterium sp. NRRL B-14859]|uniref:DUF305 domain-containing protein n=1 Tax=Chryseobacterium sp. NRRL B-14859 TaxID=1562763 RepID=UPI00339AC1C9